MGESAFLSADVFMYLPILVLTFYSFNQSRRCGLGRIHLQLVSWLFIRILSALQNSLTVLCSGYTAVLGSSNGSGLARYPFRQDVVSRHFLSTVDWFPIATVATPVF